MLRWISQVRERLESDSEEQSFYQSLLKVVEELGFELYSFRIIIDTPRYGVKIFSRNNYTATWNDYYQMERSHLVDAVYQHCRQSILPLRWSDELYTDAPQVRARIIEQGMRHGISQGVQEHSGVTSMFSMVRNSPAVEEGELLDKAGHLMWLANYLHNRELPGFLQKFALMRSRSSRVRLLSEREIEVLYLSGQGQTAEEVGLALHLTPRTVNFHIASAIAKLGVTNKTAAVVQLALMGFFNAAPRQ